MPFYKKKRHAQTKFLRLRVLKECTDAEKVMGDRVERTVGEENENEMSEWKVCHANIIWVVKKVRREACMNVNLTLRADHFFYLILH